ncbi:hypothetical protein RRG08_064802 [Elysia crispata]|uniref:Uncharacterized protein n=1 Tax=Elysia crispata TaxID=231223 RepID=A0AAE1D3W9_9GAST|nr:hypothetical protein RRG08_064802 [Elysia crispata]
MTFNFGTAPKSQANNPQTARKSSAKSMALPVSNKPSKHVTPSANAGRKSVGSTNRATPFKFTGGNTCSKLAPTSASNKTVFDLKASLAKPLSWKPHTGKLQPLDFNTSARPTAPAVAMAKTRPLAKPSRQAMAAKVRPTNVKDVIRVQQLDRRNNQKYIDMMRRRGLIVL